MARSTGLAPPADSTYLEDLVGDILQGDASALPAFYENTVARVSAEARAFTASWDDANEIVRGVYEQAWRRLSSYDPESGSVVSWLCGIARQLAAQRTPLRKP
jgi:DNA-directed RNA polymerase specialized sigma24 family protein